MNTEKDLLTFVLFLASRFGPSMVNRVDAGLSLLRLTKILKTTSQNCKFAPQDE